MRFGQFQKTSYLCATKPLLFAQHTHTMEIIYDFYCILNLNPRQIYIILREDNKQYRETFEALVRESQNDDIRFCIIDTTSFDEQPAVPSKLYQMFQDDGHPWDFIVRRYPTYKDCCFTCEHIIKHTTKDIRKQLEDLRKLQEYEIWDNIQRFFYYNLIRKSSSPYKEESFKELMKRIQQANGISDNKTKEFIDFYSVPWHYKKTVPYVRSFIGSQIALIDDFIHINTSRERSDQYMLTFMQTGRWICRPGIKVIRSEKSAKGIHSRFSLQLTTGIGKVVYPEFKFKDAFAMYLLYMRNAGERICRKDFLTGDNTKYYCQRLAAYLATIGEDLYNHSGKALQEAIRDCTSFLPEMQKSDKYWQNCNYRCDEAIKTALSEELLAEPFMLQPLGNGQKPKRWIAVSEDDIDLNEPSFKDAFDKNLAYITSHNLFNDLGPKEEEKSSNKKVSALTNLDTASDRPTFAGLFTKNMTEKMEKKTIICCGQTCIDIIWKRYLDENGRKLREELVTEEIGGTAGNVACMLAYLGWHSYPILKIGTYPQDLLARKDYERYGCDTRFVMTTDDANVNLFEMYHLMNADGSPIIDENGKLKHSFSKMHAPFSGFPRDKALRVKDEAPAFVEQLDFIPDVFFFDSPAAGYRYLAQALHQKGTLVYFEAELNGKNLKEMLPCMQYADIVKFSDEHLDDYSFIDKLSDKLVIQTLGSKGVRFKLRGGDWQQIAPIKNEKVVDTEGCGDWTSATFLTGLMKRDCLKLDRITEDVVRQSLDEAQQMAALNVSYLGSKGLIYHDKAFNLAKSDYVDPYRPLMALQPLPNKQIKNLKDIPEKDYREYLVSESFIYNSGYERIHGVETYFGKQAKELLKKGDLQPNQIAKTEEECSVMSNFYPSQLTYDGKVFNSAEQMYHYYRYQEYPVVQDVIMRQHKGSDVKTACKDFKRYDSNHDVMRWKYMTLCIEVKYLQCKAFRDKLKETDSLQLVESTPGFDIFGSTVPGWHEKVGGTYLGHDVSDKYIGMNGCGRCMMAVRDKFRGWTDKQLKAYSPSTDLEVWWQSSPTYLEQLEEMGKNEKG